MTMPSERVKALKAARAFLVDLVSERPLPKTGDIRARASACLRHFPWNSEIDRRWQDDVCFHGEDRPFCKECRDAR